MGVVQPSSGGQTRRSLESDSLPRKKKKKKKKKPKDHLRRSSSTKYKLRDLDPRLGVADMIRKSFKERDIRIENQKIERRKLKERKMRKLMEESGSNVNSRETTDDVCAKQGSSCSVELNVEGSTKSKDDQDKTKKHSKSRARKRVEKRWEKILKRKEKNEVKWLKELDTNCANMALASYNEQHSSDYELVETIGTFQGLYCGWWYHCNFKAQRKSETSSGRRPFPKLFFAELTKKEKYAVELCVKLDDRSHTVRGCRRCPQYIIHPANTCSFGFQSYH